MICTFTVVLSSILYIGSYSNVQQNLDAAYAARLKQSIADSTHAPSRLMYSLLFYLFVYLLVQTFLVTELCIFQDSKQSAYSALFLIVSIATSIIFFMPLFLDSDNTAKRAIPYPYVDNSERTATYNAIVDVYADTDKYSSTMRVIRAIRTMSIFLLLFIIVTMALLVHGGRQEFPFAMCLVFAILLLAMIGMCV